MTNIRMVFCNAPDIDIAEKIAHELVNRRQAACVNILFPCKSVYRWNDTIEKAQEIPMIIKTTQEAMDELMQTITELHPYEVPEILALNVSEGLPGYCEWLRQQVYE